MKGNFKTISTFWIIVLTGLLVGILINYYNTPIKVSNVNTDLNPINHNSVTNHPDNSVLANQNSSGESTSNSEKKTVINESGESNISIETHEDMNEIKTKEDIPKINDKTGTVIITSEDTMTNKEKREILTELDDTLMELLDVVNKVQTVDETRLITEESEVQE